MTLSPEVREIVREAAQEVLRRRLTPDEVFLEVVRVCSEAQTPEEAFAAGQLLGRIDAYGQHLMKERKSGEAPEAEIPPAEMAEAEPEPTDEAS